MTKKIKQHLDDEHIVVMTHKQHEQYHLDRMPKLPPNKELLADWLYTHYEWPSNGVIWERCILDLKRKYRKDAEALINTFFRGTK